MWTQWGQPRRWCEFFHLNFFIDICDLSCSISREYMYALGVLTLLVMFLPEPNDLLYWLIPSGLLSGQAIASPSHTITPAARICSRTDSARVAESLVVVVMSVGILRWT